MEVGVRRARAIGLLAVTRHRQRAQARDTPGIDEQLTQTACTGRAISLSPSNERGAGTFELGVRI